MTLDPGQPTKAVDLEHLDEFFAGCLAFGVACLTVIFLGWTDTLALCMAVLILASPKPLEPR